MEKIIRDLIAQADKSIKEERFDDLMEFYTDDAVLIVKPGEEIHVKEAIKKAHISISKYFNNSIVPSQGKMVLIHAGDVILVILETFLTAKKKFDNEYSMERRATYIYKNINGKWLCLIDNSYGTDLLD